ncbi:MAG: GDP-mannose 4,6-dehydratase [Lentisphaeria bacterium]|nr:GDP-mannose 4,6-dehydratase [Candidatus Neomarinimicrobiota bacterium]MCF7842392.1 GDP-mannose 4,6-dehydratase [Lentisphaeria bacterium]
MSGNKTICITGIAGFIGSHTAEACLQKGWDVVGVDNFNTFYDPEIKRRNLAGFRDKIRFYEGDIRDAGLMKQLFRENRINVVIHLAAMAGVRPSFQTPSLYVDVNLNGTNLVFRHAMEQGVEKILYASSSSVYGNAPKVPFAETDNIDHPISIYAATKRANEKQAKTWFSFAGIPMVGLRFFTVYGPRQRPEMAIHKFTRALYQNEPIALFGDGQTYRDYTYVDDIVAGILSVEAIADGYDVVNLGESQTTTLIDLIRMLEEITGQTADIRFQKMQKGDVDRTFAQIDLAREKYGYHPTTDMQTGLRRFVAWYQEAIL